MEAAVLTISRSINLVAPEAVLVLAACAILLIAPLQKQQKRSEKFTDYMIHISWFSL